MPFPNGDYSIYVPPDLTFGFFAHPWEQSLCVFGASFIEVFNNVKSPRINSLLRERSDGC